MNPKHLLDLQDPKGSTKALIWSQSHLTRQTSLNVKVLMQSLAQTTSNLYFVKTALLGSSSHVTYFGPALRQSSLVSLLISPCPRWNFGRLIFDLIGCHLSAKVLSHFLQIMALFLFKQLMLSRSMFKIFFCTKSTTFPVLFC